MQQAFFARLLEDRVVSRDGSRTRREGWKYESRLKLNCIGELESHTLKKETKQRKSI